MELLLALEVELLPAVELDTLLVDELPDGDALKKLPPSEFPVSQST